MKDICAQLDIKPKLSMAHHPQTDRQTEHMNKDVQQDFQLFIAEHEHK